MDYIIFSALKWILLVHIVITYDIACQWSKNLSKRMDKLPEDIQVDLEKTKVTAAIPSWHINGHGSDCQTNYALAFRPGSGRTCGDEIESSWSQTNVLGASVREMASGGRHETLNDHFNGANIRKIVGLRKSPPRKYVPARSWKVLSGTLLPKKLRKAAKMRKQHDAAFSKLSATFSEELRATWARMVTDWEKDPLKTANPYNDIRLGALHSMRPLLSSSRL